MNFNRLAAHDWLPKCKSNNCNITKNYIRNKKVKNCIGIQQFLKFDLGEDIKVGIAILCCGCFLREVTLCYKLKFYEINLN